MEKEKLPNSSAIIVLSIFGYLCCCCFGLGVIPAGIAFYMATKSEKIYAENPDMYDNISQIKTGKIVALVALILCILVIIRVIYVFATGDIEAAMEQSRELMEQWGIEE